MSAEQCIVNDFYTFQSIFNIEKSLQVKRKAIWQDEYGMTVIKLRKNSISMLLEEQNRKLLDYVVIISPLVKGLVVVPQNRIFTGDLRNNNIKNVISIGGAKEHNVAKESLFKIKKERRPLLTSAPIPLTNDSFGTNRSSPFFSKIEIPSRETVYPSEIIIDIDILEHTDTKFNIMGIGEVIGLYYSLCDYFSVRKLPLPEKLIDDVEKTTSNIAISVINKQSKWLNLLAIGLIKKCMVMRIAKDNQIGAGGDHLIAYAIEYCWKDVINNAYRFPHGKNVYLGSIIMAALFPEWEYKYFSLSNLIIFGIKTGILEYSDLVLLLDMSKKELIRFALKMRPFRQTVLGSVSIDKIKNAQRKINAYIKEY